MITVIAAVSADGVIGVNGEIPWNLPSDMAEFKRRTKGHVIIMGRKTWESLPGHYRPLPERENIVLTRSRGYSAPGAIVVDSLERAICMTQESEEVFIAGGDEIYRAALPYAERLLITRVHKIVGSGDALFPVLDERKWGLVSSRPGKRGGRDECNFTFEDYSPRLKFIELANVRTYSQLQVMREIRRAGHCPFCPENLPKYHRRSTIWEGNHWVLTPSQWPYPGTRLHFLLITKFHTEEIQGLPPEAGSEITEAMRIISNTQGFSGGGFCMRSGDPILSGATVKHLHAQIFCPQSGVEEPPKFYIGTSRR